MKLHIGVDSQTGLAHIALVTAANVHDKHPLPDLLYGKERRVYGDSASVSQKALIHSEAPRAKDFTNQRVKHQRRGLRDRQGEEPHQVRCAGTGGTPELSDLGLHYLVGITSAFVVWPPSVESLPPKPYSGMGLPPVMPRRTASR